MLYFINFKSGRAARYFHWPARARANLGPARLARSSGHKSLARPAPSRASPGQPVGPGGPFGALVGTSGVSKDLEHTFDLLSCFLGREGG